MNASLDSIKDSHLLYSSLLETSGKCRNSDGMEFGSRGWFALSPGAKWITHLGMP